MKMPETDALSAQKPESCINRSDILRMAREAGLHIATDVSWMPIIGLEYAEKFAALVAAHEREKVARWMMERGYATGHGDTIQDLIKEVEWQVAELENEACAKVCDEVGYRDTDTRAYYCADAIRARGEK